MRGRLDFQLAMTHYHTFGARFNTEILIFCTAVPKTVIWQDILDTGTPRDGLRLVSMFHRLIIWLIVPICQRRR